MKRYITAPQITAMLIFLMTLAVTTASANAKNRYRYGPVSYGYGPVVYGYFGILRVPQGLSVGSQ